MPTPLLTDIRACTICQDLPLGPNPILQFNPSAKILIAGQAPGRITHHKNIPFDDPSGVRLREWMGITVEQFYDPGIMAIIPMGFCFPGTGKSGDLPPRPECAANWHGKIFEQLPNLELTLIIGQYAMEYHINDGVRMTLTKRVEMWRDYFPARLPLPHPSPRNNLWLKKNPWFGTEVLPALKARVAELIA